jgi:hypothetical protein
VHNYNHGYLNTAEMNRESWMLRLNQHPVGWKMIRPFGDAANVVPSRTRLLKEDREANGYL